MFTGVCLSTGGLLVPGGCLVPVGVPGLGGCLVLWGAWSLEGVCSWGSGLVLGGDPPPERLMHPTGMYSCLATFLLKTA